MKCVSRRSIHVVISADAAEYVRETAEKTGAECPEVIRDALCAYKYLRRIAEEDGQVLIQRADGSRERVTNL